ncbi:MAG: (2Fe-2S)-binding protein, partial [Candidatus Symbiothrix sp.]|nr:(2Fe-2S)-binding protein [Candidatus Symbiothrix sp.]
MKIYINNKEVETLPGETLIEVARREGFSIPSLCYAKDAKHKSSCMVCAVKNCATGQIIPSCTTLPVEGMQIDSESPDVKLTRTLSLELLLSDHRADCEAPCSMVCPKGLDVELLLKQYDAECYGEAKSLLASVFSLPEIGCDDCKAPCEKACRRGTLDQSVSIRAIIKEIAESPEISKPFNCQLSIVNYQFQSKLGRFTLAEKEQLKATTATRSRCLHCACSGQHDCKLRLYASEYGIKRSRYTASSDLPLEKIHINDNLYFEPAKCIRCG